MPFEEKDVIQLYEWYNNLEFRLQPILEVMPVVDRESLTKIISPRIVPFLMESCSILDSIMRLIVPERMTRPNGKTITWRGANIFDYCREINPLLALKKTKSIVMIPMPFIISPFKDWTTTGPNKMQWWKLYNSLKHDRLRWSKKLTLLHAIESLCALHQLMVRIPHIIAMSFRFNWVELSGYNPEVLLEGLPNEISPQLSTFLSYTKLFCTPLSIQKWETLADIHPVSFKNSSRLLHFLGRMM